MTNEEIEKFREDTKRRIKENKEKCKKYKKIKEKLDSLQGEDINNPKYLELQAKLEELKDYMTKDDIILDEAAKYRTNTNRPSNIYVTYRIPFVDRMFNILFYGEQYDKYYKNDQYYNIESGEIEQVYFMEKRTFEKGKNIIRLLNKLEWYDFDYFDKLVKDKYRLHLIYFKYLLKHGKENEKLLKKLAEEIGSYGQKVKVKTSSGDISN